MSVDEIRGAKITDVIEIKRIIDAVWPDNEITTNRIEGVLNDPNHSTMVFVTEGVIAGFVDGFLTISSEGTNRWELDLLAVHPDFQRRGIASTLVTSNTTIGKLMGAEIARGLVAVDNIGSQKSFAKSGYETNNVVCELMIASEINQIEEVTEVDNNTLIILVNTMNYSGLWVEGKRSKIGFVSALKQVAEVGTDLAGAVVPSDESAVIADALSLGFEKVGRYQWWQRPLR